MLIVTKDTLEASICKESLYDFTQRFWGEVSSETPVWNWHIPALCGELQTVAERLFKRQPKEYDLIINIPPGTTKSIICSIMYPAWAWTRDPSLWHISGSYADQLGLKMAVASRRVIQSEKYQRLFPNVRIVDDQNQKGFYETTARGGRKATSVGGTVTGYHAHSIVIDDPLNPLQAASNVELASANMWMTETLPSRYVNKEISVMILIMQRLHQSDPTGTQLENAKAKNRESSIRHICLPAILTDSVRPRKYRHFYKDGLLDPVRLPLAILKETEDKMGPYPYAGQYMQNPIPRTGAIFNVALLHIDPAAPSLRDVVRYWDKASTEKGGCFTVGVKMGVDTAGTYWLLDVVRGQWDPFHREDMIRQTAIADGRKVRIGIEEEGGSGGKESAINTVKRLAGFVVWRHKPTGDKQERAQPFAAQVCSENVRLVAGLWNRPYIEELQYFPKGTYKDQVDASSGAFTMLTRKMKVGAL